MLSHRFFRCHASSLIVALGFLHFSYGEPPASSSRATDPGVRDGAPASGGPISGLSSDEMARFLDGQSTFQEVDSVTGSMPGEPGLGLGPSFNLNSCSGCHAFPAVGGSSPKLNPQVAVATLDGAQNVVPSFISPDGPVRVARFKRKADGSPDGGVHDLFVITGRADAPAACQLPQTDFAAQAKRDNLSFRIPTPAFGAGLIEAIPDAAIMANKSQTAFLKAMFLISGHENRNGNDGTITRYGWKAQNKSIAIFSGEAYHVEQGVTNLLFPSAREMSAECDPNNHPEDATDVVQFAAFLTMLAPPAPVTSYGSVSETSVRSGRIKFLESGCALCHTESLTTGASSIPALSHQTVQLFSDLLVHNMGSGLADGISQGNAGPDEFRTAPLWGLGQRIFFLHDGRTSNLLEAIQAHASPGSEANTTVRIFNRFSEADKQDLLNFLRSL